MTNQLVISWHSLAGLGWGGGLIFFKYFNRNFLEFQN